MSDPQEKPETVGETELPEELVPDGWEKPEDGDDADAAVADEKEPG
jgi:hypothetical protein